MIIDELFEAPQQCPECGGISFSDLILAEKKDACYYKVKASAKVWPSAYASGRLVQCRKKGAANYGNKSEGVAEGVSVVDQDYDLDQIILTLDIEGKRASFTYTDYDENFANAERRDVFDQLQQQPWYKGLDHPTKMEILDAAYRAIRGLEPAEYKPTVGDEPLDEQGMAEKQELDEKWSDKYKRSINCANPRGFSQRAHCAGRKKNEDVAEGEEPKTIWHGGLTIAGPGSDAKAQQLDIDHELGETRRGQVPMTLQAGETDNIEPENFAAFRQLPAYKLGQQAQQKAGKQLIQKSPYTYQSDQDFAYRQGAFDTQQAAMFANFGQSKPLTTEQQVGEGKKYIVTYRDSSGQTLTALVPAEDEYDARDKFNHATDDNHISVGMPRLARGNEQTNTVWKYFGRRGGSGYSMLVDTTSGMAEGEQQPGADYRDPREVNYDDEYDAMVARVKRLAGLGPMKTVYDPNKRQYRNMPTAQQPKK